MSRNFAKDDPIADAREYANRPIPNRGKCCICHKPILIWETYYEIEDELIHDDCIFDWVSQFRKYP